MLGVIPRRKSPYASGPTRVAFTVGTEATNAIAVNGVVYGPNGRALADTVIDVYLSGTAGGADIVGTAPTGGMAIGTYGKILASIVTNKMVKVKTDSSGRFTLTLTDSGTPTFYMIAVLPDGTTVASGAITFA